MKQENLEGNYLREPRACYLKQEKHGGELFKRVASLRQWFVALNIENRICCGINYLKEEKLGGNYLREPRAYYLKQEKHGGKLFKGAASLLFEAGKT